MILKSLIIIFYLFIHNLQIYICYEILIKLIILTCKLGYKSFLFWWRWWSFSFWWRWRRCFSLWWWWGRCFSLWWWRSSFSCWSFSCRRWSCFSWSLCWRGGRLSSRFLVIFFNFFLCIFRCLCFWSFCFSSISC